MAPPSGSAPPGRRCASRCRIAPLSFARAVNRGIARARYSHICLLNNDMLLEPGFFGALAGAFERVPGLFCATAQIRFPEGVRREETGKTVMAQSHPEDFPIRCDEPLPGEDLSYVLYGSGGCSLYDAARLRALGGVDQAYEPAYVEDLDLGYRAWQRGWPSVYVAGAVVEHRHRATTSRYYTDAQLERNPGSQLPEVSGPRGGQREAVPQAVAAGNPKTADRRSARPAQNRRADGAGRRAAGRAGVPGGADSGAHQRRRGSLPRAGRFRPPARTDRQSYLRSSIRWRRSQMYNLMRRVAADFDPVLVAFTKRLATPSPEILAASVGGGSGAGGAASRRFPRRLAPNRAQVAAGGGSPRGPTNGAVRRRLRAGSRHPGGSGHHVDRKIPGNQKTLACTIKSEAALAVPAYGLPQVLLVLMAGKC